jgi:hypothetical protein
MKRRDFSQAMKSNTSVLHWVLILCLTIISAPIFAQNVTLTCPVIADICSEDNLTCSADVIIPPLTASTDCATGSTLTFSYTSPTLGNGTIPAAGITINTAPIGTHEITITAMDECGETDACTFSVNIIDCRGPAPICINGLAVELTTALEPDTDIDGDGDFDVAAEQIWALDFIASPITDCTEPITYSINRVLDTPDINQSSIFVTCDDAAAPVVLQIYAWDSAFNPYSVQPDGTLGGPNYDFCETYLLVQDNVFDFCDPQNPLTVEGQILTPDGQPIVGVELYGETGFLMGYTNDEGRYSITASSSSLLSLRPFYNRDRLNGIDVNDLYAAEVVLPTDPYKQIAGDINFDDALSTFDIVQLNSIVLGFNQTDPSPSWRFIDAAYVFPNPNDAWFEDFPEIVSINNPATDTVVANFTGIKIGDLDCSANPNLPEYNLQMISGKVFNDFNEDCALNSGELGFGNWVVRVEYNDLTVFTSTTDDGDYALQVPQGDYTISVLSAANIWEFCANDLPLTVHPGTPVIQNFPVKPLVNTPIMDVDISALTFRRCEDNSYHVQYCNQGTMAAEEAYVDINFDEYLTILNSSKPWSQVEDQLYRFDLGAVNPGECGNFSINFNVSCDALLGQTHCTEARIYPNFIDVDPTTDWDGSSLEVSSECANDSIYFEIKNKGEDMQNPSQFIVIEDDLIMTVGSVKLNAGESRIIAQAANGTTKRLSVNQALGHPGNSHPGAVIEGCGTNAQGEVSLGFVSLFPDNDADPYISIECRQNVGSYDPNDKQGFPRGATENHLIEANTDIEYLIRFQNTGTDFARDVIIRDTIDTSVLDITSVRPGASSHEYDYFLSGDGIINFVFDDIMLLDSNTNEAASHGFVKFRISQNDNNPDGTIIENKAAIYFDYNDPIITNYTLHTVGFPYGVALNANIEGKVRKPNLEPVPDVNVKLTPGDLEQWTDMAGEFSFNDLATGEAYDLDFDKDDIPGNGITSFDLVLLAKHILGVTTLNPYQLIAADVNQSGSLTVLDLVEIRKWILSLPNAFDDVEPWIFIDANHTFSDPTNPWEEGLPEGIQIEELVANTEVEAIGIKMGDINGNSDPFTAEDPENRSDILPLKLSTTLKHLGNKAYLLDVKADQFQQVSAYQFGMNLPAGWSIQAIESINLPGLSPEHFNYNADRISTCWYHTEAIDLTPESLLFSLLLEGPATNGDAFSVELANSNMTNQVFGQYGQSGAIILNESEHQISQQLLIAPNPGKKGMQIQATISADTYVSIDILNIEGKVMHQLIVKEWMESSVLNLMIPDELKSGVYFLSMSTDEDTITRRFVKL